MNCTLTRVNHAIRTRTSFWLGALGVTSLFIGYILLSYHRHSINPMDQMTPTPNMILEAIKQATTPDEFTSEVPLIEDIKASLALLLTGFSISAIISLVVGLHAGAWPWLSSLLEPVLKLLSYIPTIAVLFIIFVTLGYGNDAKVFLICFATSIPLVRSLMLHVKAVPDRQIWNFETCGASNLEVIWVLLRRTVEPKFLDDLRLQLGSAWIYLIIAELINAPAGLGYRINVASRNLNVSMIIVYVMVISLIAFLMDKGFVYLTQYRNKWALR